MCVYVMFGAFFSSQKKNNCITSQVGLRACGRQSGSAWWRCKHLPSAKLCSSEHKVIGEDHPKPALCCTDRLAWVVSFLESPALVVLTSSSGRL